MGQEEENTENSRYFIPFRLVLTFRDENSPDYLDIGFQGVRFSSELAEYLQTKHNRDIRIIWVESKYGSLENFNILEIDALDIFELFVGIFAKALLSWFSGRLALFNSHSHIPLEGWQKTPS